MLNYSLPTTQDICRIQWHPAIMKFHGIEKNVPYSGVFVMAKSPL